MSAERVIAALIVSFAVVARADGPPTGPAAAPEAIARADRPAARGSVNQATTLAAVAEPEKKEDAAPPRLVPERLGPEDITRSVAQHRGELDACVKDFHALPATTNGELVMVWTILPDGDTEEISSENADPDNMSLAHCLRDLVDNWYFSQHLVTQRVQFKFKY
jgi:hypothetical protein